MRQRCRRSRSTSAAAADTLRIPGGHAWGWPPARRSARGPGRQPLALSAQHDANRAVGTGQVVDRGGRLSVEADHVHACVADARQRSRQAPDHGDGQVLHGSGGRLGRRRRDVDARWRGSTTPVTPATGGSQDRPEVPGIGDAVQRNEERRHGPAIPTAATGGVVGAGPSGDQVVEVCLGQRCREASTPGAPRPAPGGAPARRRSGAPGWIRPARGCPAGSARRPRRAPSTPPGPGGCPPAGARGPPGGPRPGRPPVPDRTGRRGPAGPRYLTGPGSASRPGRW